MKTGDYAYFDGTISSEFDKDKKLKGIVVVEDDYHAFLVLPKDFKDVDWWDGKMECEKLFAEMPNMRQCQAIYDNKEILNKSLTVARFLPIDNKKVWSSTEYRSNHAWSLNMNDGIRGSNFKFNNTLNVRPVVTL